MDFEALLMGVINNRLTAQVAKNAQAVEHEDRRVPNSSRRAFESRMKSDATVARMAAQNMEDASAMVTAAQSNITAIKSKFMEIRNVLKNFGIADQTFTSESFYNAADMIKEHTAEIERLAKNTSFNGMKLFDGGSMQDSGTSSDTHFVGQQMNDAVTDSPYTSDNEGTIVFEIQAGESIRNQKFVNLCDPNGTVFDGSRTSASGSLDLSKATLDSVLTKFMTPITDASLSEADKVSQAKTAALQLIDVADKYVTRMQDLEARYSYDIKSLDNLKILFENQADIYDETRKRSEEKQNTTTSDNRAALLSELLATMSGNSILSGTS